MKIIWKIFPTNWEGVIRYDMPTSRDASASKNFLQKSLEAHYNRCNDRGKTATDATVSRKQSSKVFH